MNNCLILLLLLFCCGNNSGCGNSNDGCGSNISDGCRCGGRDSRNDGRGRDKDRDRDDSCRERGFASFPSPGSTCGCEEKES